MNRLETRPPTSGNIVTVWGPWTTPVILQSIIAEIGAINGDPYRRPMLRVELVGAGTIAVFYGSAIRTENNTTVSAFAGASLLDSEQQTVITPATGVVTWTPLTNTIPCVIPLPNRFVIASRATLTFTLIGGIVDDDITGLIATVEDVPEFRE